MWQNSVVLLVVLWSMLRVLRRLMPTTVYRVQAKLAQGCAQAGWLRLAAWLSPRAPSGGCGSGCSSCSTGCAPSAAPATTVKPDSDIQPVQWR